MYMVTWFKGEGVDKDVEVVLELWKGAAVRGFGEAHLCLYQAYSQGEWIDMELAKATEYFEGAANVEGPISIYLFAEKFLDREEGLARRKRKDDKEVIASHLRDWVSLQDGEAMCELAYHVDDPKKTLELLYRARRMRVDKALGTEVDPDHARRYRARWPHSSR
ncbi:hypothetical protein BJ684DRAFT_14729 [Piptocephalis cylindrospora]|uniref:Uncharacterized protein n=1 Tax=Piptocephalis cylindrospora TaxID=1907219 RepID=A0A4P9Y876_9FUNG|nr:hypothetical protein BJ684DRAFT_14729 [Piptocephalis cylindrospora]|eukprot:RKP14984.1 hypothetical protein BJ684DRAFT_14729 [Piptocephalis cylindrospora]